MNLMEKARSYFRALGYEGADEKRSDYPENLILIRKASDAAGTDSRYIWVQESKPDKVDKSWEAKLIKDLQKVSEKRKRGSFTFLIYNRENLSREFKKNLDDLGFQIIEEAFLFDAEFKSEWNPEISDASREIISDANREREFRIKQPFEILNSALTSEKEGSDLVTFVAETLNKKTNSPKIYLLIGPAGVGKSSAFNAIFQKCYQKFIEKKARKEESTRPLPLLPKHILRKQGAMFSDVLSTFLQMEMSRQLQPEALNWYLDQGRASLFVDGLDEVLASDSSIFNEYFYERLTGNESKCQILLCVRDSLLNSCRSLRNFIDESQGYLDIYRLAPWTKSCRLDYAQSRLKNHVQQKEFIKITTISDNSSVSGNAYCCKLIADEVASGKAVNSSSLPELHQKLSESFIQREFNKGILDNLNLEEKDIIEYLHAIGENFWENDSKPISIPEMRSWANLIASEEYSEQVIQKLIQLPFFISSKEKNTLEFGHELWGAYFYASRLASILNAKNLGQHQNFCRKINQTDLTKNSLVVGILGLLIPIEELLKILKTGDQYLDDKGFRNLFFVILTTPNAANLKWSEFPIENRELDGARFDKAVLTGTNFDGCDLSGVVFEGCDLRKASFKGTFFQNTNFNKCIMTGALIGNLNKFSSLVIDGKQYITAEQAIHYFRVKSGEISAESLPPKINPDILQIRLMFRKLIDENGEGRRKSIDLKGFMDGKIIHGANPKDKILKKLMQSGYLFDGQGPRRGIRRAEGDKYKEMVEFVKTGRPSQNLQILIEGI